MKRRVALLLGAGLAAVVPVRALDPPHDASRSIECASCHTTHTAPGGAITTVAGNANLCLSCHQPGGTAAAKPFNLADQALPGPGLPAGTDAAGTSHRWDSGASGHVTPVATNTSSGRVQSGGVFTGRYPKAYTLTITTAGNAGSARFSWSATTPGGGSGTDVLSGASVALDEGVTVTFTDGAVSPSFVPGDRWVVYARTDLAQPTTTALAQRLESGKLTCSTCHNQHSQAAVPFDPAAPAYGGSGTGEGRHFQRVANDVDQMCTDCHAARNVSASTAGSHPVGRPVVPAAGRFQAPLLLPLDATTQQVRCTTCHTLHYSPRADGTLVRVANLTALCSDCHILADTATGAHFSTSRGVFWPGGQYGSTYPAVSDATRRGSCNNCHQPHGWPDSASPASDYPRLLVDREENVCFTCHDGSPVTKSIYSTYNLTSVHPTRTYSGRHAPDENRAAQFGTPNRHAECPDCHNMHRLQTDLTLPVAPALPNRLKGVSGVSVANGAGGSLPAYTFVENVAAEYELCFKCHSSWTTQPAGQSNLALDFNPNNLSFHPVEALGRNTGIRAGAFANGWSETSRTYCTDCHSSSDVTVRGPHGSANAFVLERPYTASSASRVMSSGENCFECHNYDTYANNSATTTVKGYSRFNSPTFSRGHTYHVGQRRYPCYACHETHGLNRQHLIATGRNPGLNGYTHSANGGTCSPTCHGSESYTVNY